MQSIDKSLLCPICGRPRKKANRYNSATGDNYYVTCGREECSIKMQSIKCKAGRKEIVGKKEKRILTGSVENIRKKQRKEENCVRCGKPKPKGQVHCDSCKEILHYLDGVRIHNSMRIVKENKYYKKQKKKEARDFFEELKAKAKEKCK